MQELIRQAKELLGSIDSAITQLGLPADEAEIASLNGQTLQADFWQDPQAAAAVSQKLAALTKHVAAWRGLQTDVAGVVELAESATATEAEALRADLEVALATARDAYDARAFELKLSGPHDRAGAIIELHAGTGGTDAQDWTAMLQRMYLRWAEQSGYTADIISSSSGEEAGLKSATIEINGPYAYGKLKGEAGVHRLVRLSPFNADSLRQTSFALVEVLPQLEGAGELVQVQCSLAQHRL